MFDGVPSRTGGSNRPSHRASIATSRPHDQSFRVSKLATQIKDSVITSFGASRAIVLSTGLMRINKNLNVVICKAFYKWFYLTNPPNVSKGDTGGRGRAISAAGKNNSSSNGNSLAAIVLKNYIRRFSQKTLRMALYQWQKLLNIVPSQTLLPIPELREENARLRRKSALLEPSEHSTFGLVRRRLGLVFSNNNRQQIRKGFDRWKSLSQILSYRIEMQRQHIKVEIGMQHIRSENKKISDVHAENGKLQSWLLCSIFFMKWKIKDTNQRLLDERDIRFKEREVVYKRVTSLKKRLVYAQQVERDAVATAALRGNEFCERMQALQLEFEIAVTPTNRSVYASSSSTDNSDKQKQFDFGKK
jgi:hypothetical protein